MFMKQIRGTSEFWKDQLLTLLSMFETHGLPTLFVTVSANDYEWPALRHIYKGTGYNLQDLQNLLTTLIKL